MPNPTGTIANAGYSNAADFARFSNTANNPVSQVSLTPQIPSPTQNQPAAIAPTISNGGTQTTTPTGVTKTSPVITAAPATQNLQNIQANTATATGAITNQAATVAAQQQAASEKAAADKAAADQLAIQQQEQANKAATINAVTAPESSTTSTQTTQASPTNPVQTDLASQLKDVSTARDAVFAQFQSTIQSYQQGTIPLTPTQQALVSSMQSVANEVRQAQVLANSNYVGGITTLQNSLGTARYAPDLAMGAIQNAVSSGLQKLTDLDAKAAQSLAQVEQADEDQNFKVIQTSYDDYNKYLDDKQKTITDTYNAVQTQADNLRTYNLDLAKFQESTKEANTAETEKEQVDLWTHNYQMEDLAIKKEQANTAASQANALTSLGGGTVNPVTTGANGKPDPTQQAAFLATLPVMTQTILKSLTGYNFDPKLTGMSPNQRTQILGLAHEYDPTYDEGQYATIHKTIADFTSGKDEQNVTSLNQSIGHLASLAQGISSLPNGSVTKANAIKNYIQSQFGGPNQAATELNINALTSELATTFKGGGRGATDSEIALLKQGFNVNASPDQFNAAINKTIDLLGSRLESLDATYQAGAGREAPDGLIIHDNTLKTLSAFKDAGYNVPIPGVPFSNPQSFYASSPDNAQVWDQTLQQMQQLEQGGQLDPNAVYAPADVLKSIYIAHPELLDVTTYIPFGVGADPDPSSPFSKTQGGGPPQREFIGS